VKSHRIDFEPVGRRGECPAGRSLLEAGGALGVELASLCGGEGTCHRCRVQVISVVLIAATLKDYTKTGFNAGYLAPKITSEIGPFMKHLVETPVAIIMLE
jgi:uncharacterized 2Fe-2S/4Fe-4S cluster protein (DUF4445 family)